MFKVQSYLRIPDKQVTDLKVLLANPTDFFIEISNKSEIMALERDLDFDYLDGVISLKYYDQEIISFLHNGTILPEPYIAKYPEIKDIEAIKIPANSYYVLGDERLQSFDSRQLGPISQSDMIGIIEP